jgi:hypothetical protein
MRLIDRILRKEEINGHNACPTYLYRWTLLRLGKLLAVYLHHFVGDDWALDPHDHPKRFISIGLRGGYIEQTPAAGVIGAVNEHVYRAPWLRTFEAEHRHRLRMLAPGKDCWTLVVVTRAVRPWGFWKDGRFVPWRKYVQPGVSRPACD